MQTESSALSVNLLGSTGGQGEVTQATQYEMAGFAQSLGLSGSSMEGGGDSGKSGELSDVEETALRIKAQLEAESAQMSSSSKPEDGF